MTTDQQNLLAHLNGIRVKTEAWVAEDPKNRWACYSVCDVEHWASIGITTVAGYEHYNLVCQAFEMTREVFGYKPSWGGLNRMTDEALKTEIEFLAEQSRLEREAEKREEEREAAMVEKVMTRSSGWTIGELAVAF